MAATWTTWVLGPVYTLLPRSWRAAICPESERFLTRAATISGVAEALIAARVLSLWYVHFFSMLGDHYARYASSREAIMAPEIVGEAGFLVFASYPLTWVILYFGLEGIFRSFAAAVGNEVLGIFPLYAVERLCRLVRVRRTAPCVPLVPDEITPGDATCDIKISSCRKRSGWEYPFTIRYERAYFQVIAERFIGAGPRPYIYSLRRLPLGEVARGLKDYHPDDVLVPEHRVESLG